jgi:hypothetical protein
LGGLFEHFGVEGGAALPCGGERIGVREGLSEFGLGAVAFGDGAGDLVVDLGAGVGEVRGAVFQAGDQPEWPFGVEFVEGDGECAAGDFVEFEDQARVG